MADDPILPPPNPSKPETSGYHIALNKALQPEDGKTYLGDPESVDALLRTFLAERMTRRGNIGNEADWEAAKAEEKAAFERMADIFLGKVPAEYETIGAWNEQGDIAKFCAESIGIVRKGPEDDRAVMAAVFALLLAEVVTMTETEGATADDVEVHAEQSIDDWKRMLLGIPAEIPAGTDLGDMAAALA